METVETKGRDRIIKRKKNNKNSEDATRKDMSHDSWQGHDSDQDREGSCRDHRDQAECTNLYKKQKRTRHRPQHTC
ncbi:hypothetical protein DBV15_02370 [Temnothorax longispinosus]|uniref:Uncharacterized protein n=1 Tax=Temnothorax longispinosus TaxID=300112 RepID=A0A4S2JRV5_9HYME|nr:hypothetical protein DBV15_02370 [Temnothorax longispinosus]